MFLSKLFSNNNNTINYFYCNNKRIISPEEVNTDVKKLISRSIKDKTDPFEICYNIINGIPEDNEVGIIRCRKFVVKNLSYEKKEEEENVSNRKYIPYFHYYQLWYAIDISKNICYVSNKLINIVINVLNENKDDYNVIDTIVIQSSVFPKKNLLNKSDLVKYIENLMIVDAVIGTSWKGTVEGGYQKPRKGSYESMTLKELQQRCAKKGIAYSGKRKAQLVSILRNK